MLPRLIYRLPLREYIFANYQEQIATKYKVKKCVTIPTDYYYDLETIRSDLNRDANVIQDKGTKQNQITDTFYFVVEICQTTCTFSISYRRLRIESDNMIRINFSQDPISN